MLAQPALEASSTRDDGMKAIKEVSQNKKRIATFNSISDWLDVKFPPY